MRAMLLALAALVAPAALPGAEAQVSVAIGPVGVSCSGPSAAVAVSPPAPPTVSATPPTCSLALPAP